VALVVCSVIFDGTLRNRTVTHFHTLSNFGLLLIQKISHLREAFPGHLLLQQDGTPSHYHLDEREFLDEQLPRREEFF
jgi:hypothetical protein